MATWFITGSSRGIGLGLCKALLGQGETVIGACRNPEGARDHWELVQDFKGRFRSVALDVSNEGQIKQVGMDFAKESIDVLVNNAGVMLGDSDDFNTLKFDDLMKSFQINSIAPMQVTRALLPSLLKSKSPKVAHITSKMGSIAENTIGGYYAYRMSKAALNMFHKSFAREFSEICSLTLHPGWVQTEMGGKGARDTVHDSCEGLIQVVERATLKDSGSFFDFKGEKVPW